MIIVYQYVDRSDDEFEVPTQWQGEANIVPMWYAFDAYYAGEFRSIWIVPGSIDCEGKRIF